MAAALVDFFLGEWHMRQGDRLPMLGLTLEADTGEPLNLTGAVCTLMLRHEDGLNPLIIEQSVLPIVDGWLHLPAYVYDPPNGVVLYDWPQIETESLTLGMFQLMVEARWPNGDMVTVPPARDARRLVRDTVL